MSEASEWFTELLFGTGQWYGLLLILSLVILLSAKEKYAGLLMLPICIYLAIDYLSYETPLLWNALIMLCACVFIIINLSKHND